MPDNANNSSVGQGFFDNPQTTFSPGLEPPGFDLLRDFLMRRIFQMGQNPYGLSQQGVQGMGDQPLFSNQLRPQASLSYMQGGGQPQQGGMGMGGGQGQTRTLPPRGGQGQLGGFWQDMQRAGSQPNHDGMGIGLPMAGQPSYDGGSAIGHPLLNVMSGGINGVNQLLGGNYSNMNLGPQLELPGYSFTGGQHEFGGNPDMANAASSAGWDPQMMARWLAQGQQGRNSARNATLAQNPGYNASRWGTAAQRQGSGYGVQTAQNNWGRGGTNQPQSWQQMNPGSHSAQGSTPQNTDPNNPFGVAQAPPTAPRQATPVPKMTPPTDPRQVTRQANPMAPFPTEGNNPVRP